LVGLDCNLKKSSECIDLNNSGTLSACTQFFFKTSISDGYSALHHAEVVRRIAPCRDILKTTMLALTLLFAESELSARLCITASTEVQSSNPHSEKCRASHKMLEEDCFDDDGLYDEMFDFTFSDVELDFSGGVATTTGSSHATDSSSKQLAITSVPNMCNDTV